MAVLVKQGGGKTQSKYNVYSIANSCNNAHNDDRLLKPYPICFYYEIITIGTFAVRVAGTMIATWIYVYYRKVVVDRAS